MLELIVSFLKAAFYTLFINEYLQHKFPEKYNEFLINSTYNVIYIYSKGQIVAYKIKNQINTVWNKYKYIVHKKQDAKYNTIEYILDGSVLKKENLNNNNIENVPTNYDFIIISQNVSAIENASVNKRIIKKLEEWDNSFEKSDIQFIRVEVMHNDKKIQIDLKTPEYNYYLVNNKIDEMFIKYFLKKHTNGEIQFTNANDVTVHILDHNVNSLQYNIDKDDIYITKTNYFRKSDIITED
jgi:hypothetical protein